MNFSFLKGISISILALLFSLAVNADPAEGANEAGKSTGTSETTQTNQTKESTGTTQTTGAPADFQARCTEAWMKKADEAKDKLDFKNFGEKYCACAAKLPLDNDEAISKAAKLCISRTLLHDTMDSIEDDIGLDKAKDTDIADYCKNKWEIVLPKQTDGDKKLISAYCECAKPKLVDLLKRSNDMTDKQYYDEIDSIADACAESAVSSNPK